MKNNFTEKRNIKIALQYDGTAFCGYEIQPGKRTIRGELEKALLKIFKKKIKLISSSRTDSGVHALASVINFKIGHPIPIANLVKALNAALPEDIRIIKAEEKSKGFNARFDAKSKEYEYLIYNGEILPVHLKNIVWQVKPALSLYAMRRAAKILEGKHDFSSFCASGGDDKDFSRTMHRISIRKRKLSLWKGCEWSVVSCKFIGNGFLYKMVRNIVGTIVDVGLGRITVDDFKRIVKAKDRKLAGRTAPAQGLCLVRVNY